MDPLRFDILTKSLAAPDTRRRLLRLLAVLPLGVTLLTGVRADITRADPGDPEQGGSHRRKRRKRRHDPGGDQDNRHGKRRGKGKDKRTHKTTDTGTGTGTVGDLCQGRADRTCCAGATGQRWCQGGACVAIPDDALATLAECRGRCDCPPDLAGCDGDPRASEPICGKALSCPSCATCSELGCGTPWPLTTAEGLFWYCTAGLVLICPAPGTPPECGCFGPAVCFAICFGTT